MRMTIEAIYEAGILKPLVPLPDLPEHTKVRIMVGAMAGTESHGSVIDTQRQNRLRLDAQVARDIGDSHEYALLESEAVLSAIPAGVVYYLAATFLERSPF
jgi:predicted DNA-binding antitoxin AbrB/MazE fold protein